MTGAADDPQLLGPRLRAVLWAVVMFLIPLLTAGLYGGDWALGAIIGAGAALGTLTSRRTWRKG